MGYEVHWLSCFVASFWFKMAAANASDAQGRRHEPYVFLKYLLLISLGFLSLKIGRCWVRVLKTEEETGAVADARLEVGLLMHNS